MRWMEQRSDVAERPAHRILPAFELPRAHLVIHLRLEAAVARPGLGKGLHVRPHPCPAARKPCGTKCGGFEDHRTVDRRIDQVGQALHRPVGGNHAAIDAKDDIAIVVLPVLVHGIQQVTGLVADGLQCRASKFRRAGAARQAEHRAARFGIPPGRAETDEGGHEIDFLRIVCLVRERPVSGAEPIIFSPSRSH